MARIERSFPSPEDICKDENIQRKLLLVELELGHTSPKSAPDDTSEQIIQSKQLRKRDKKLRKNYSETASEQNSLCRDNRALPLLVLLRCDGRVIIHLQE